MAHEETGQETAVTQSILRKNGKLKSSFYDKELARLQEELIKLQY